jgi:hypothetical protein
MHKWPFAAAFLVVASCSRPGVTYLSCVVGDQTDKPWRFKLDEQHGRFEVKVDGAPEVSGKAEFMTEEIRLVADGNDGQVAFFINRKDLTWGQLGGPAGGQCVKTDAPDRQI